MVYSRGLAVADKTPSWQYNHFMRIGIDCRLPTYRMGGISQYILNLMPALAYLDQENEYLVFHSRKELGSFLPPNGQNWHHRTLWTPPHHRFERWVLPFELAPHGLDLFHSPDFIPPQSGATRRVITVHDLTFIHYPELLTHESRSYYLDQIQWAVDTADFISADSHATRKDIIEKLNVSPDKVVTIHLAANPLYTHAVVPSQVEYTLDHFGLERGFYLSVGTLEPRKNLPFLLSIYARLRNERNVKAPLVLVGKKGWLYEDIFSAIADLDLSPFVLHFDAVSDEQLRHFYHAACALVTPSLYEGFGLPALEAQHCGCPAVVSDRGSLPEIVGPEGIILDLADENAWVETLALLNADEDFRNQVVAIGGKQAQRFKWSETARQTLDLYLGNTN
jgi:glycosyltransferase involved in cell wall biosynthesis